MAAVLAVGACGDTKPVGTVGYVKGFGGLIAADEPRAVVAGRDVLSAGGTAADAAVAAYFTLAVTYPSTASLGGGGMCIVHDSAKKKTEVIDFVAPPSGVAGRIANAVPANPRGFFALHAKYGKLRWESLLADAERMARVGVPVSRALATDLGRGMEFLSRDAGARNVFFRPDGSVLREGDMMVQPGLAAVIANLRRSPGDLYAGLGARELVNATTAIGGTLSLEDLRDFKPQWRDTLSVKVGNEDAHFAPPPAVASTVAAQLVGTLWSRYESIPEDERNHLLAETSARGFAERSHWMMPTGWTNEMPAILVTPKRLEALAAGYSPDHHTIVDTSSRPTDAQAGTGFVILDSNGSAIACSITTYGLFGSGRIAGTTGIVLAGAPGPNGPPAIAPMMSVNAKTNQVHFVGAASGGVTAPSALATVFLGATAAKAPLAEAEAKPRVVHPGNPDVVFAESGPTAVDASPLQRRGHQIATVPMPSRVNAIHCPTGEQNERQCQVATDPRGFGMAVTVGKN
jgi:gamma-glutamyltranspeptidase/glutathione hydrolase